jgi:hypothetical protein
MKLIDLQIGNQIGKELLQSSEIHEIPSDCFSYCSSQVKHFLDTKSMDARYKLLKFFTVAYTWILYLFEVSGAI